MKCLPTAKLSLAKGNVLHDWHAEVLALRAFNRFLVDECADLARRGVGSRGRWVRWRRSGEGMAPFVLHDEVGIHMFCSEAPCGDASMELTMVGLEDCAPWIYSSPAESELAEGGMLGRGYFDQLGVVRRKPSRGDAPGTLSKSCSDKLAMKQCTGLLSGLVARLVEGRDVYLGTLVLPEGQCVRRACERAFGDGGRLAPLVDAEVQGRWEESGYGFRPFEVKSTGREFEYSRRSNTSTTASGGEPVPSNLSVLNTPGRQELLINGVLQGRKQFDPKGASCVSRRSLWRAVVDVALLADVTCLGTECSYEEVKEDARLDGRRRVQRDVRDLALKGWRRNTGDEDWCLEGS